MTLKRSQVVATNKVRVAYSLNVKQVAASNTDDSLNPANYQLIGGEWVYIRSVLAVDTKTVELTVDIIDPTVSYTLYVYNVESSGGLSQSGNTSVESLSLIKSVTPVGLTKLSIVLYGFVKITSAVLNPSSYIVTPIGHSNTVDVTSVSVFATDVIVLSVTGMKEKLKYTVELADGVDLAAGSSEDYAILLL